MLDAILIFFGVYLVLANQFTNIGLALLGNGLNIFMLHMAIPGHPLPESIILTAIVIGFSIIVLWSHYE